MKSIEAAWARSGSDFPKSSAETLLGASYVIVVPQNTRLWRSRICPCKWNLAPLALQWSINGRISRCLRG